jgi:arylsulfatase A-like enzyme
MLSLIRMRWRKLFLFLSLALIIGCREHKKGLKDLILQSPEDIVDPALYKLNPEMKFYRVRVGNQIRRATPYIPGQKIHLVAPGSRLKFYLGIIPDYFSKYPTPVQVQLFADDAQGTGAVWSITISPKDAPGWKMVEINLPPHRETMAFSSDVQDYGLVITPPLFGAPSNQKPSVVFILIDALRADHLGAYGYKKDTSPNIDALALKGAVFENVVTTAPFTATSLASFFTGTYPWENGVIFTDNLFLSQNFETLASRMRDAGYQTAGFSSTYFHLSDFDLTRGFDYFDESCDKYFFDRDADCLSGQIIKWIDERPVQPFFIYLHYTTTHSPYHPPEQYREMFSKGLKVPGGEVGQGDISSFNKNHKWYRMLRDPSPDELAWLISQYDGEVRYADEQIATVLKKLQAAGLDQNILFIVTADHGEAFFEHRLMDHPDELHWPVTRVPLIVSGPRIPEGAKISALARTVDVAPFILKYAGLPPLPKAFGKSLLPLITGDDSGPRVGYSVLYQSRKKYQISAVKYPYHILAREPGDKDLELYNIGTDPLEKNNLAAQSPDILKEMFKLVPGPDQVLARSKSDRGHQDQETQKRLKALHYVK